MVAKLPQNLQDESAMPKKLLSADERYDYGNSLREKTPLESHTEWLPGASRKDPVKLIEGQNEDRIPWLIPVRRARMSVSPFAFYRGTARIMAHDLAGSPVSGINTQICGDAHLANFGAYASPERRLVFDLNDFDETLPGPWEWDVKRLAASFVLAGRHNGLSKKETRKVTERVVRSYRQSMQKMAGMRVVEIWNSLIEAEELLLLLEQKKLKKKAQSGIKKTMTKDSMHALQKLAEEVDGKYRIRSERPLIIPVREIRRKYRGEDVRTLAMDAFEEYKETVPDHISHLLGKYRVVDFAVKVVGVGSVGTRCFIVLLEGRDRHDPLFLQIKQATKSVLEEHLPNSPYRNPARRVVEGQLLMQTVSDIFLGYNKATTHGHSYYWRQLKDWKGSADVDSATVEELNAYSQTRGWTLARAHARTGDPIAIAGYLGEGKTIDRTITTFAEQYADQCEQDYAKFVSEIEDGRLEAAEIE
jgi:uncharacterized protein (DUF2252 family)